MVLPLADGTLKTSLGNIYVIFFNSDFSLDIASIFIKLAGNVLYNILEGKMSQNVDLGPGHGFMLCRNFKKNRLQSRHSIDYTSETKIMPNGDTHDQWFSIDLQLKFKWSNFASFWKTL